VPVKILLTIGTLAVLLTVPDLIPQYKDYKVLDWSTIPLLLEFHAKASIEEEQLRLKPTVDAVTAQNATLLAGNMEHFYEALRQRETGQDRVVRILHYGDSPTTADMITADARVLLQKRFGDAGHGYHLIAKPWAWYEHRGVTVSADGWKIDPANQSSVKDGLYGLGGVSFRGSPGAHSHFSFRSTPAKIEVHFLPGEGRLETSTGPVDLSTREGFVTLPGASPFELKVTSGQVRLFGIRALDERPGVLYESLGLNGAYISVLDKMFNEAHWSEHLRRAQPDLVIINYGTNESVYAQFVDKAFEKELRETVRRIRAAVPDSSILIMSPMDRGQRDSTGSISTVPALHRLVNIEQKTATDLGVGFFNTFEAMGGSGTMARWYQAEPRLVGADFIHPMPAGAKIVGGLLEKALMEGYRRYKTRVLTERFAQQ
jgi:lysophospholipase L1-like esterase